MKYLIPLTCACTLGAAALQAQTAFELLDSGANKLFAGDYTGAQADISQALILDPTDPQTRILDALTSIVTYPGTAQFSGEYETITGKKLLFSAENGYHVVDGEILGEPVVIDALLYLAESNGPANYNSLALQNMLAAALIPELEQIEAALSDMESGRLPYLTVFEDDLDNQIIMNLADAQLLRACVNGALLNLKFLLSYNLGITLFADSIPDNSDPFYRAFPDFLTIQDEQMLADAEEHGRIAIQLYIQAADALVADSDGFFQPDQELIESHPELKASLEMALSSLDSPVVPVAESPSTVYLGALFDGALTQSTIPSFYEGYFLTNTIPDPTFGGLLPEMNRGMLDEILAEEDTDSDLVHPNLVGSYFGYMWVSERGFCDPVGGSSYPIACWVPFYAWHYEHGWVYYEDYWHPEYGTKLNPYNWASEGSAKYFYIYDIGSWVWGSKEFGQWLYRFSDSAWIYYYKGGQPNDRWFWSNTNGFEHVTE